MSDKLLRAPWHPIAENTVTLVAWYVLGVVSALLTVPNTPSGHLYEGLFPELFLDVYGVALLLLLLPRRCRGWRRGAKCLLSVVFYGVAMADVYCFEQYGSSLTPSMLMLVGETDRREAGEFLRSLLSWETLTGGVGWLLLLALAHAVASAVLPGALSRWVARRHTPAGGGRADRKTLARVGSLITLVLLVWSLVAVWENKKGIGRLLMLESVGQVENEITRYHRAELYLPIYRLAFSLRANQLAARQVQQLVDAAGKVQVDSCSFTSPTIVLIIGESYNKHHSQLYGYYMPTTPRQLQREKTGQLVKFTDVVTPWNLTSFVFKHMFSLHVVGQEGDWCDYPLFPEVFKRAGYDVTFLTNQFLTKAKDAVYDFSGGFFLNDPQLSQAMFDHRNTQMHPWDDGLLRDWDEMASARRSAPQPSSVREESHAVSAAQTALSTGPKRQNADPPVPSSHGEGLEEGAPSLVIFHLLGQHMNYYSRYPRQQTHFTADDYQPHRPRMLPRRKQQLVWYDNATLYNDSIVDQILRRFEQEDAIVVYVPDHGEEVYEPGRFVICRNHTDDIDYPLAHYEYEVPFWVWCSRRYQEAHPDMVRQIRAAKDRPLMTDALPHMLLYLAGIHTKDYRPEYNILSSSYQASRPRLLKGRVDYDRLPRDMSSRRTANHPKK